MSTLQNSGIFLIDKPQGLTSHDVVHHVRRITKTREVGHAGTLDPMATGILVIAVREATKLVPYLTGHTKTYYATIKLGIETDSYDADGNVIEQRELTKELYQQLDMYQNQQESILLNQALTIERNRVEQIPPVVSAIHIDGERAYKKARRGEHIEMPSRPVSVYTLNIYKVDVTTAEVTIEVTCSKGYYVRALARDFAKNFGTIGHLISLRRIQSGPFSIDECCPWVGIENNESKYWTPLEHVGPRILPTLRLTKDGVRKASYGQKSSEQDWTEQALEETYFWTTDSGEPIAIGRCHRTLDGHIEGQVVRGFR